MNNIAPITTLSQVTLNYFIENEQAVSSDKVNQETVNKIKETLSVPITSKDEFWVIEGMASSAQSEKKILGIFKKKTLSLEEINDLRKLK